MGYVPPIRPDGIITLPDYATPEDVEQVRKLWAHPRLGTMPLNGRYYAVGGGSYRPPPPYSTLPSFGQQYSFGEPGPEGPFDRYRRDLYGRRGRDWLPFMGYGLVFSVIALILDVIWMLGGQPWF